MLDAAKKAIGTLKLIHGSECEKLSPQNAEELDTIYKKLCKSEYNLLDGLAKDVNKVGVEILLV